MIRRLLLVVGIIVSLSSCGGDIAYRIEGKLTNLEDQTLYAVFENEDIKVVDTVTCGKPGEFLIEKKQGDFREVTIFLDVYKRQESTCIAVSLLTATFPIDSVYHRIISIYTSLRFNP